MCKEPKILKTVGILQLDLMLTLDDVYGRYDVGLIQTETSQRGGPTFVGAKSNTAKQKTWVGLILFQNYDNFICSEKKTI